MGPLLPWKSDMRPMDRLTGKVGAETMNRVDAELSKDMTSTPCNTRMAVAAERSLFPCGDSTSNHQRTPNMLEEPREPNMAQSQLLKRGSLLINGYQMQASGTSTEAIKGNGSSQSSSYVFVSWHISLHKANYV